MHAEVPVFGVVDVRHSPACPKKNQAYKIVGVNGHCLQFYRGGLPSPISIAIIPCVGPPEGP
jgi:hypothetical protein